MKKKSTAIICWIFNLHRFYLGQVGLGILFLVTAGGLGIWCLLDGIKIFSGKMTDSEGNLLE